MTQFGNDNLCTFCNVDNEQVIDVYVDIVITFFLIIAVRVLLLTNFAIFHYFATNYEFNILKGKSCTANWLLLFREN